MSLFTISTAIKWNLSKHWTNLKNNEDDFLSHQTSELTEIWNLSKHRTNLTNNVFQNSYFYPFLRQFCVCRFSFFFRPYKKISFLYFSKKNVIFFFDFFFIAANFFCTFQTKKRNTKTNYLIVWTLKKAVSSFKEIKKMRFEIIIFRLPGSYFSLIAHTV